MKKILITGADSYIGTSFEKYIQKKYPSDYQVDIVDMKESSWRHSDFSGYDSIFHVAGIAHSDTGNVSDERKALYYAVNTDLAEETAIKAKNEGVGQFIYMSSSIVYGDSAPIGRTKMIYKDTPVSPSNFYGDSKVQAEMKLRRLQSDAFNVCILRPPMIYGRGSKGNFPVLEKIAKKLPVFPRISNQRSMLFIDNLSEFVRLMVENKENGVFWPQNEEYGNTSRIVEMIAEANGKKVIFVRGTEWMLKLLSHFTVLVNKAFGNLTYDREISEYKENYRVVGLEESIRITEGKQ